MAAVDGRRGLENADDEHEVKWGRPRIVNELDPRKAKLRIYYQSFILEGQEYFLYENVYLKSADGPPYIGKIGNLFEKVQTKEKVMLVRWFFRPCELPEGLLNVDYSESCKEIFLAADGEGSMNFNNPVCTLGKCTVVCTANESWNAMPSVEEIAKADHYFSRAFNTGKLCLENLDLIKAKNGLEFLVGSRKTEESVKEKNVVESSGSLVAIQCRRRSYGGFAKGKALIRLPAAVNTGSDGQSRSLTVYKTGQVIFVGHDNDQSGTRGIANSESPLLVPRSGADKCQERSCGGASTQYTGNGSEIPAFSSLRREEESLEMKTEKSCNLSGDQKSPRERLSEHEKQRPELVKHARPRDTEEKMRSRPSSKHGTAVSLKRRRTDPSDLVLENGKSKKPKVDGASSRTTPDPLRIPGPTINGEIPSKLSGKNTKNKHPAESPNPHKTEQKPRSLASGPTSKLAMKHFSSAEGTAGVIGKSSGEALQRRAQGKKLDSNGGRSTNPPTVRKVQASLPIGDGPKDEVLPSYPGKKNPADHQTSRTSLPLGEDRRKEHLLPPRGKEIKYSKGHNNPSESDKNGSIRKEAARLSSGVVEESARRNKPRSPSREEMDRLKTSKVNEAGPGPSRDRINQNESLLQLKKKIFKFPWDASVEEAVSNGKALLLQNLDPFFSSNDIEALLEDVLQITCDVRVLPPRNITCYKSGQYVALFRSQRTAEDVLRKLTENLLICSSDDRAVQASILKSRNWKFNSFHGFLNDEKLGYKAKDSEDKRNAVATSHCSQANTVEYELGLQWRVVQERHSQAWKILEELEAEPEPELLHLKSKEMVQRPSPGTFQKGESPMRAIKVGEPTRGNSLQDTLHRDDRSIKFRETQKSYEGGLRCGSFYKGRQFQIYGNNKRLKGSDRLPHSFHRRF